MMRRFIPSLLFAVQLWALSAVTVGAASFGTKGPDRVAPPAQPPLQDSSIPVASNFSAITDMLDDDDDGGDVDGDAESDIEIVDLPALVLPIAGANQNSSVPTANDQMVRRDETLTLKLWYSRRRIRTASNQSLVAVPVDPGTLRSALEGMLAFANNQSKSERKSYLKASASGLSLVISSVAADPPHQLPWNYVADAAQSFLDDMDDMERKDSNRTFVGVIKDDQQQAWFNVAVNSDCIDVPISEADSAAAVGSTLGTGNDSAATGDGWANTNPGGRTLQASDLESVPRLLGLDMKYKSVTDKVAMRIIYGALSEALNQVAQSQGSFKEVVIRIGDMKWILTAVGEPLSASLVYSMLYLTRAVVGGKYRSAVGRRQGGFSTSTQLIPLIVGEFSDGQALFARFSVSHSSRVASWCVARLGQVRRFVNCFAHDEL